MDIRADAHRLLDELDDDQIATATDFLRDLVGQRCSLEDDQEGVNEPLPEYSQHHEDDRQRAAAVQDDLAILLSRDLDHPDPNSAWH